MLVLALLSSSLLGGKILSAGDATWFQPPFAVERPADLKRPSNSDVTDPVSQFYPDLWRSRQALEHGSLPLWNPNVGAGRPLLASQQPALLFPTQWLVFLLPFWASFGYIVALKLLIAAIGVYVFCRALEIDAGPALLAGTAFAFSTYLITWITYPLSNAWVLLPWLFLAGRRTCRCGRPLDALGLSVLIGVLLFAGHPESELIVLTALAAYMLFELYEGRREERLSGRASAGRAGLAALALIGGLALSAVVTLPFVEFLSHAYPTPRGGEPGLPTSDMYRWVFPELWGRPDKLFYRVTAGNYQERTAYIGVLPLLLALGGLAIRPRRAQLFFAGLAAIALCIVIRTPVRDLVMGLPKANYIALSRLLVLVSFAAAMLAGYGLQRLVDASPRDRRRVLGVMAVLALLPLAWLFGHSLSHWQDALGQLPAVGKNEKSGRVVQLAAVWRWALIALVGVGVLALLARLGPRGRLAVVCVALAVTATDLITLNHGYQPAVAKARADPPAPAVLRDVRARAGSSRVMGADLTFLPNLADRYGLLDPRAYDFPIPDRYYRLFTSLGGGGKPSLTGVVRLNDPRIVQLADLFAVRYVLLPVVGPLPSNGLDRPFEVNLGALPRSWVAYSWRPVTGQRTALSQTVASSASQSRDSPVIEGARAAPAAAAPAATPARITVDRDEEVQVQVAAQRAGYLILDDTYYPGWHANVDGHSAPILPANENFRAVPIPAGRHVVSFRYRPASVIAGAAISSSVALAMALAGALLWRRRQRGRTNAHAAR